MRARADAMRKRSATIAVVLLASAAGTLACGRGAPPQAARAWEGTLALPTYEEGLPDANPPFDLVLDRRFSYPYTLRMNLTDRRVTREWRALYLENEYLRCAVLPDLGGHLYNCTDKVNGAEMFYANPSIKVAQIAYRGAWTALGVEFNFPVSHNWMTASPVDFAVRAGGDGGASVWVGNIDRPYGMQWRVELTLRPGRSVLEQRTTLYNRSDTRHRFYWWTNAGVEVWDDSRILYPMRFTASHGFADVDTWPVAANGVDLSVVGNHTFGPVSRFSHGSREPFMAVYHPRTRAGVVHYSSPEDLPSKKIWSWSSDAAGLDWRRALSDNESAYVEIQAGLFRNQETYAFLDPQESIHLTEYWLPLREIDGLTRATPDAALNLTRDGTTVTVALNVTRALAGASLTIESGAGDRRPGAGGATAADAAARHETVSLTPAEVFTRTYRDVPEGEPCTVTLADADGRVVVRHTEGEFDYVPEEAITTGPQQGDVFPPAASRGEGDYLTFGQSQELDGRLLDALANYREGLARHPASVELNRAAGLLLVGLKRYEEAAPHLEAVLARVTNDRQASYYSGLAAAARGDLEQARLSWEIAQQFGAERAPALFALAGLAAREGRPDAALDTIERLVAAKPDAVRAGGLEVALLRALGRAADAASRLAMWRVMDPTSAFLRYEATRLGTDDPALWRHLAADPERVIEIAVDYMHAGLWNEAVALLDHPYPRGDGVVSEPGMPHPSEYPLVAYYRGYCRLMAGGDPAADFRAASAMPVTYVFPNRPQTFPVLEAALAADPDDRTARFLLGALYLSGGQVEPAMREWETTRRLRPDTPTLHRNMAYTVLRGGGPVARAIELFKEGRTHDPLNVGLYFGLDEALTKAERPAGERADALLAFPDRDAMPAALVYTLVVALADAGRVDEADAQFEGRFFPRQEGGINVRQIYLEARLKRARALAAAGDCAGARAVVAGLTTPVEGLEFTRDGLEPYLARPALAALAAAVRRACPGE